jgi:hypothetical protein
VEFVDETRTAPVGSYDVVLSRFGLMFAVDHVAAFRALADVPRPRWCAGRRDVRPADTTSDVDGPDSAWQTARRVAAGTRHTGTFRHVRPGQLIEELAAAGFVEVPVVEQVAPFRFDSVDEYIRFNKANVPPPMLDLIRTRFGSTDAAEALGVRRSSGSRPRRSPRSGSSWSRTRAWSRNRPSATRNRCCGRLAPPAPVICAPAWRSGPRHGGTPTIR